MMRDGRSYMDAAYPFSHIDRASAVACIMTGTVPYDNGIVGEHWMDRKTLRPMYCVDDATCEGWLTSEKYSPVALNVSTVTDELKMATGGRALVYSIAPDADAAIRIGPCVMTFPTVCPVVFPNCPGLQSVRL